IENMHRYNALEITWSQDDDVMGDDILIDAQRRMTVYPDQAMEFVIPPIVYQPHVGKRVLVKYTINLGAGMKSNLQWQPSGLTNVE
ncbi:hypothetical protein, partial [Pseudomonas sp. SIMBA_044]|uniref:hypothetical protein n=1 Tax=Pseudomonas sp. SIMBA_044 TaxID=3085785 RepID=UPI00397E0EDC